ncbi:MAG: hypothetical protein WC697_01335 [Patescibacteria group bacterium]|jgi:hypothetical protein
MPRKWLNLFLFFSGYIFSLKQKIVGAKNGIVALPYVFLFLLTESAFLIISLPFYLVVSPKKLQENGFIFPSKEKAQKHFSVYIIRRKISLATLFSAGGIFLLKFIFIGLVSSYLIGAQALLAATQNWDFNTSSNYTYDSAKIEVVSGVARLKDQGTGGSCGGTPTACTTFISSPTCVAQAGCSWSGSASGATTNPGFNTDTAGWVYVDWEDGARASGMRVLNNGNPGAYVNLSFTNRNNNTSSGYWEQSFTTTASNPTATLNFDWRTPSYSSPGLTSFILYVFVDSTSGAPTLGTQVWSQTVTAASNWASVTGLNVGSKLTTARPYYLKIVARRITGPGTSGTNTAGFDNIQLSWSKAASCSGSPTACNTFITSPACSAQSGCSWTSTPVYPSDSPAIYPVNSLAPVNLTSWNSFNETATKNGGAINYQLSSDDGLTWKYWNNSVWATASTSANSNDASIIGSHITSFPVTTGKIMWRAFLVSNGSQQVILDDVSVGYIQNSPPNISSIVAQQDTSSGYVHINYNLQDNESDPCNLVNYEYSLTGAFSGEQTTMTPVSFNPADSLSSSPSGVAHTFTWNALADLGNVYNNTVYVRLRANDVIANSNFISSSAISVDYVLPIVSNVTATQLSSSTDIQIGYDLFDNTTDNILIELQVSSNGGSNWTVPVVSTSGDIGATVTSGNGKTIIWHAGTDFANQEQNNMMVRVRAKDKYQNQSNYVDSASFILDNKAPVIATPTDLLAQPLAGATTVLIGGSFTESNPNTNNFYVAINGGDYGLEQIGDADTATPSDKSVSVGVTLKGNDYISAVKIKHTDDFGYTTENKNSSPNHLYKYVKPFTPPAPTVNSPTENSLNVTINKNSSEIDGLEYAIFESTQSLYVQSDGSLGSNPYWQATGTITVSGLSQPITQYNFETKSRNTSDTGHAVSSESDFSSGASSDYQSPQITINSTAQKTDGTKYVVVNYTGTDHQNQTNNLVTYEYSLNGTDWQTMTEKSGVGSDGVTNLAFNSSGTNLVFHWDVGADLPDVEDSAVYVRLESNDSVTNSNIAVSSAFVVNTAGPVISNISVNQISNTNNVTITYDLADGAGANNIVVSSVSDDSGATYNVFTPSGDVGSGVTAGLAKNIIWNAAVDFVNQEKNTMRIKLIATDSYGNQGAPIESGDFSIDTKSPVVSNVSASQTPGSALVTVNYDLSDMSSSSVEFSVSSNGGMSWNVAANTYTGDMGDSQTAGSKSFNWNAVVDFPDQESATMQIRVRALDVFGHQGAYQESSNFSVNTKILSISNITAVQTLGAKTVTIHYNLNKTANISLDISADGGTTWTVPKTTLTGHLGEGISAGNNKTITWNAGIDFNNEEKSTMRVRLSGVDALGITSPYYESADFSVDTASPLGLISLSKFSNTDNSVTMNWSAGITDAHFNHYELWHGANQNDVINRSGTAAKWDATDDMNLNAITTISTVITNINLTGDYFVKIWAIDDYGNETTVDDINVYIPPTEGTLTVHKVVINDNGGTATVDDFVLKVNDTVVANGDKKSYLAGSFTVSEIGLSGYNPTFSGDCDASGHINIMASNDYSCTITNNDIQPKVTVNKVVINNNGGTASSGDYSLLIGSDAITNGVQSAIDAGSYTVNESGPSGYTASFSGDCNSSGQIILNIGDVKTCTITNDDNIPPPPTKGALTITKVVINDNGGSAVANDFTLKVGATSVTNGVSENFNAGDYTVTETGIAGYKAIFSGDCDADGNITIVAGNTYACTIINNDIQPKITVNKVVVNNNGGKFTASGFLLFVGLTSVTNGVNTGIDAGNYTVNENGPSGYTASYDGDCDNTGLVTLNIGDVKTCTITNDDNPPPPPTKGTLTVTKVVVNDNGGNAIVNDFNLKVGATIVVSGDANDFTAGTYNVSETEPIGYDATFSGDCSANGNINIVAGHSYSCTITSNDIQPKIIVNKVVVNNNGGTLSANDFPLFVGLMSVANGVQAGADAGNYTVYENNSDGYTANYSDDCDIAGKVTLNIGDVKICTITNDDNPPPPPTKGSVTVRKVIINDNGGTAVVNNFVLKVDTTGMVNGISKDFVSGTYTISDAGPIGYAETFSGDCDASGKIIVAAGNTYSCSIISDDIQPKIIVKKVVVNNNSGTSVASDFSLFAGLTSVVNNIETGVDADNYTINESGPSGYTATFSGDCNSSGQLTLNVGDVKTCTITNDDNIPPPPTQGSLTVTKIVINDNNGMSAVNAFGLKVGNAAVNSGISNNFLAGTYNVSETGPTGYDVAIYGGDCDANGKITIVAGNSYDCSITNNDTAAVVSGGGGYTPAVITLPGKPILSPLASPTNITSINISGLAEVGSKIDLYDNGVLIKRLDNATDNNGRFSQIINFSEGEHIITAKAINLFNNIGEASDSINLKIKTTPPSAPIVLSPKNEDRITNSTPNLVGVAESLSQIEITLDEKNKFTTTANTDGAWQFKIPTDFALKDGAHLFALIAIDQTGNKSVVVKLNLNKIILPIETTKEEKIIKTPVIKPGTVPVINPIVRPIPIVPAPEVISVPLPVAPLIRENVEAIELAGVPTPIVTNINTVVANDMFTFTGTALPNQDVIVYVHSDQALIYRTKADENGVWKVNHSQDLIELTPGEHTIFAVAIDPDAKIKSQPSPIVTFTVSRNFWVLLFNRLNLKTTVFSLIIILLTMIWLHQIRKRETMGI